MSKNILVTGGAGYIGSHTAAQLVEAGYRPVILDNFSNSQPSVKSRLKKLSGQNIPFYNHDYQDSAKLSDTLAKENIEGVIHFAAHKAVGESLQRPLKYYRNNVAGLVTLLETLERHAIPNLVFSSSCTVYGEPDSLPITETAETKPATSPYGATKQMCETIIRDSTAASPSLKSISLRYFNPIGAHPSALIGELPLGVPANLVPYVAQTAAKIRKELTVNGDDYPTPDGTCIRDYIHVVDLAKAHVKSLDYLFGQPAAFYDTFNIGAGKGNSVLEVIKTFQEVNNTQVPYKIGPRREGDIVKIYAAADKAKTKLGWQAELTLADALRDAWRWQQTLE